MLSSLLTFIINHSPIIYLNQSLWRDEVFSFFMAKPNIIQIIINTANDFNPPLYYILLHFWIKLIGQSDVGLRLLSFFFHMGTVLVAYQLAKKIYTQRFSLFVFIFTLFNPMLLFYAFEIRMYSLYSLLTISTLYFLYTKNWKWYTIFGVLGLYTHSFFPLIIFSYLILTWFIGYAKKEIYYHILKPILYYLPWLPIITIQFFQSNNSWLYPVDLQLVKSVLGNLFTNYEGTPGNFWQMTFILSIIILIFLFISFKRKRKVSLYFLTPIFFPVFIILTYSMIKQPIYVNRYLIFVVVFEIFGITMGIWVIKNKIFKSISASLWLMFILYFNFYFPSHISKTDFKSTFLEINKIATRQDYTYTRTPLSFLESVYYYKYPNKVFVYNPDNIAIPNYIGINVLFNNPSQKNFPHQPSRTYLINDDGSYELILNN